LEAILEGKERTEAGLDEINEEVLDSVAALEKEVEERSAVIGLLLAHSKEEIRKRKIEMFEKIAKKNDFQEEKVRNPWAMSKLNLRTPYIDTLERRHMEEEIQK
jgi:hypothetical protein